MSDGRVTPGGVLFVGVTAVMAAMDGALLGLAIATGVGFVACKHIGKLMQRPVDAIYDKTARDMQDRVNNIKDKELRARQEKQLKKDLADLRAQKEKDDLGRNEAAKWMGIGVFAFPLAYVAAAAALKLLNDKDTVVVRTDTSA